MTWAAFVVTRFTWPDNRPSTLCTKHQGWISNNQRTEVAERILGTSPNVIITAERLYLSLMIPRPRGKSSSRARILAVKQIPLDFLGAVMITFQ